jgi:hypothetical protein
MSLQRSLIVIIKRGCLNGYKTMKMHSQNLFLLGQTTWNKDNIKKRCLVQNAQNIGMVDTVFEALVCDKSFSETCDFRRSHAIRHDQQAECKTDSQHISSYGYYQER